MPTAPHQFQRWRRLSATLVAGLVISVGVGAFPGIPKGTGKFAGVIWGHWLTLLLPLCVFPAITQQTSPLVSSVPETVVVVGTREPVTLGESPCSVVVMDTQEHPLALKPRKTIYLPTPSTFIIELRGCRAALKTVLPHFRCR